jgi:hypothetical protein
MNKSGTNWILVACLIFLVAHAAALPQPYSTEGTSKITATPGITECSSNLCSGNETGSTLTVAGEMDALKNRSPRIIVIEHNVLRGKPLYVNKPSPDLLKRTVRIWKFNEKITVSTQSATEFFGRAPIVSESTGMLLSPDETVTAAGTNITMILEYPASQDNYDVLLDSKTGQVSNSLTGKVLFDLKDTSSSSADESLAAFLDAINNDQGKDSFTLYRVNITEPFIRVNPVTSMTKGPSLNITGTTNLPADDALIGKLQSSNLFNHYKGPSSTIHVVAGDRSENTWSWIIRTDTLPLSEYFLSVEPRDQNVNVFAVSNLFSVLPENGTPVNELGYFGIRSNGGSLKSCNINQPFCNGSLGFDIDFIGQYDRVVQFYDPDSLNITDAAIIKKCGATSWIPPKTVNTIAVTIHRVNNKTLIFDPVENVCFTDSRYVDLLHMWSCGGCKYGLIINFSYPNPSIAYPKIAYPKKEMYYMIGTGYLWQDAMNVTPQITASNVTGVDYSGKIIFISDDRLNVTRTPKRSLEGDNGTRSPHSTPKASILVFPVLCAIAFVSLIQSAGKKRKD